MPNFYDYFAGGMISNGIFWTWSRLLGYLIEIVQEPLIEVMLLYSSIIIYIISGMVSSFLVCKRTESKHYEVSFRLSIISWIFSIFSMVFILNEISIVMSIAILICYIFGGLISVSFILRGKKTQISQELF